MDKKKKLSRAERYALRFTKTVTESMSEMNLNESQPNASGRQSRSRKRSVRAFKEEKALDEKENVPEQDQTQKEEQVQEADENEMGEMESEIKSSEQLIIDTVQNEDIPESEEQPNLDDVEVIPIDNYPVVQQSSTFVNYNNDDWLAINKKEGSQEEEEEQQVISQACIEEEVKWQSVNLEPLGPSQPGTEHGSRQLSVKGSKMRQSIIESIASPNFGEEEIKVDNENLAPKTLFSRRQSARASKVPTRPPVYEQSEESAAESDEELEFITKSEMIQHINQTVEEPSSNQSETHFHNSIRNYRLSAAINRCGERLDCSIDRTKEEAERPIRVWELMNCGEKFTIADRKHFEQRITDQQAFFDKNPSTHQDVIRAHEALISAFNIATKETQSQYPPTLLVGKMPDLLQIL